MKISVILPAYLGTYDGCRPDREADFLKAVRSFMKQTHKDKELIIVSDGCERTNELFWHNSRTNYGWGEHRIALKKIDKQPLFSGAVRQAGLDVATGDIVCYLDSDDELMPHHLENIACTFQEKLVWIYFNSYWRLHELGGKLAVMDAELEKGKINTSNFAHRREGVAARWDGFVGKQENWHFISQLISQYKSVRKVAGAGYIINNNSIEKITTQPL